MDSPRPAKRVRRRLACEPCRRKKSKCPGEKPACSFCMRLGQACNYAEEIAHGYANQSPLASSPIIVQEHPGPERSRTEERLIMLENKLAEVVKTVSSHPPLQDQTASRNSLSSVSQATPLLGDQDVSFKPSALPRWSTVRSATEIYIRFCDCQPLPLFDTEDLLETLKERDQEVLLSILALGLRFSKYSVMQENTVDLTEGYAETARRLVMKRVTNGPVELGTLQSLCLLSFIDFTNGYKHRSSIYCGLASNLAQCAGLTTETLYSVPNSRTEERRRCFWSIFLLKRLHTADVRVIDFLSDENCPQYPRTIGIHRNPEAFYSSGTTASSSAKDLGVMAYAIQLTEVWCKTTKYTRRRATPSSIPPWSPQSEYSTIMAQQMDFETRMPHIHRFKQSGFANKSQLDLASNRSYWGPWLFVQFLYHINLCLLNHPLILALRLRNFKKMMPEVFLQHTSDLIATHAGWVVYLIDAVKEKSFKVSDPFLGHCAAIVATIFLQESISVDENVRREKLRAFGKCFEFVHGFEDEWPHIARLSGKLQQLKNTVFTSYQSSNNPQIPTRGLLIDLARLWEVLDYSSASELSETTGMLFGSSLYSGNRNHTGEVMDMSASLPTPTRLQSATEHSGIHNINYDAAPLNSRVPDTPALDVAPQAQPFVQGNYIGGIAEPVYSDDELAILADSFFNQRFDFMGTTDEWWSTGNL